MYTIYHKIIFVFTFLTIIGTLNAKTGYGHGQQDWGFVDVRQGAHMFYWLYKTTAKVSNYTERPLALWLQGGPGDSSTGFGNFRELGPLDVDGKNRSLTWVKDMNVLFLDNPVGSGFSFVDNVRYLTTNNSQIVTDLMQFIKIFYKTHTEFVKVPLYVFGESYGGKMAADFVWELYNAIQRKEINCNLAAVTLADPLISIVDTIFAWAPYLRTLGFVDQDGFNNIQWSVNKMFDFIKKEQWIPASGQYGITTGIITEETKGVDFYNVLKPQKVEGSVPTMLRSNILKGTLIPFGDDDAEKLQSLMRGPVSKALGIPSYVVWGSQSLDTFDSLVGDLLKPVNQTVQHLLNKTNLKVNVISGQLDLICATEGTVSWIEKLQWNSRNEFVNAPRKSIDIEGILEGYEKSGGNFGLFWILRAGHMTTADNPAAISHILKKITNLE